MTKSFRLAYIGIGIGVLGIGYGIYTNLQNKKKSEIESTFREALMNKFEGLKFRFVDSEGKILLILTIKDVLF